MLFPQDRISRAPVKSENGEGFIAKLEAAAVFTIFSVFSAVTLVTACAKRFARKGHPPETGW